MLRLRNIESFDLPELEPYRTLKRPLEHQQAGIFVAEGEKIVRRLLESRLGVVSVLLSEEMFQHMQPLLAARPEDLPVFLGPKKLLESLIGYTLYKGALAVGRVPPMPLLADLLRTNPRPLFLAAADGINSAENLGALIRNCAAFGVHALLVGETCCNPFLRRSVRNSMGTLFKLPTLELGNLAETIADLRARGIRFVAAHPHASQHTLTQADLTGDCCIVFGSEGHGLSPAVREACDECVVIPMSKDVDSLNVSSAGAVFLYEVCRQRGLM